jgi:uncharacterized protein (TIGR03435 family)
MASERCFRQGQVCLPDRPGLATVVATGISMPGVTGALGLLMRGPVIDRTGIKGTFDVNLKWSDDLATADSPDAPPSLRTALRETLGLDLKRGRGPVDVLVIERIELPSAN